MTFPNGLADSPNVLIPRQRTLSHSIALGLAVTNVIPNITIARAQFKPVTCAKLFLDS